MVYQYNKSHFAYIFLGRFKSKGILISLTPVRHDNMYCSSWLGPRTAFCPHIVRQITQYSWECRYVLACALKPSYLYSPAPLKNVQEMLFFHYLNYKILKFSLLCCCSQQNRKNRVDCPFLLALQLLLEGEGCVKQCRKKWVGKKTGNAVLWKM